MLPHLLPTVFFALTLSCGIVSHGETSGQPVDVSFGPAEPSADVLVVLKEEWVLDGGKRLFDAMRSASTVGLVDEKRDALLDWVKEKADAEGKTGSALTILDYPSVAVFVRGDQVRRIVFSPLKTKSVEVDWE